MKPWQYYTLLGIAGCCLVLAFANIFYGKSNQALQTLLQTQQAELQAIQVEINKGAVAQQYGTNMLRDMASVAVKNAAMKQLLANNGYNISVQPAPSDTQATSTPKPEGSKPTPEESKPTPEPPKPKVE